MFKSFTGRTISLFLAAGTLALLLSGCAGLSGRAGLTTNEGPHLQERF